MCYFREEVETPRLQVSLAVRFYDWVLCKVHLEDPLSSGPGRGVACYLFICFEMPRGVALS